MPFSWTLGRTGRAVLLGTGAAGASIIGVAPSGSLAASDESYLANWSSRVREARDSQPGWSSPLVTTTALLEQRFRFDTAFQHSGNGADTISLDGGKGLDLIVGSAEEVQIGAPPYLFRDAPSGEGRLAGLGDWPFLRFKERFASRPEGAGNYALSAWLQVQAPVGATRLTSHAWTFLPTLGFGKGWGHFDIQGTVGALVPTAYESRVGTQLLSNLAFQYQVGLLWPQIEVNWTYFPDGPRSGKNQVFLTPGLVVGKIPIVKPVKLTLGVGYQSAVTPNFRASPLTPAYNHAWIVSSRVSF